VTGEAISEWQTLCRSKASGTLIHCAGGFTKGTMKPRVWKFKDYVWQTHQLRPFFRLLKASFECRQFQSLDGEGIFILNGVLHSHLAGREMRLRHLRGGRELPLILEDNNYDFNFQASYNRQDGMKRLLDLNTVFHLFFNTNKTKMSILYTVFYRI